MNWTQLQIQLGRQLAQSLQGLVEGAAADVTVYAETIAAELVVALSLGDAKAVLELKAQLKLLAEMQRVRIAAEKEQFVLSLISTAINAATSGLLAAGAQLGNIEGA